MLAMLETLFEGESNKAVNDDFRGFNLNIINLTAIEATQKRL